ncbi:MAG: hydantoinase B/oxoprolinase family protein [Nitrospinota bacterium]|jgi:N-methylhydantoinase B|nr:hydantoinase B/oxoprolinase family protein [Nitrospinota bacterium]
MNVTNDAPGVSPAMIEIIKNSLTAITDEMGMALKKSSYSPNIKTREDHTCSLFNDRLEMLAQTAHQIGHLGAFPFIVKKTMKEHDVNRLEPGDTIILNDPYRGGTHLPDIILISPIFFGGRLWGFVGNLAHHSDVGGMSPGSMSGTATEIFQEGIRIPSVMYMRKGKVIPDIQKMILANVRTPEERKGDLSAQVAANNIGIRRVNELIDQYGLSELNRYCDSLIEYCERRMRSEIRKIPDGTYEAEDFMDDDGTTDKPIRVKLRIDKWDEDITFDFTGTDEQRLGPCNADYYQTMSLVMYTLRCITDPDIPQNEGCYRPIRLIVPKGTALNREFPAASAAGWEITRRVIDVFCRALKEVMRESVPAGSNGALNQFSFGGPMPEEGRYAVYETMGGGFGARYNKDGMDGVHSVSNTKNTPVEEMELNYPVLYRRYSLWPDSEGPGKFRGGVGMMREITFLTDVTVTSITDRVKFKPWGIGKGGEGSGSDFLIDSIDSPRRMKSKDLQRLKAGDTLCMHTTGGGGYGDSKERDSELVRLDVADEKISPGRAREKYDWDGNPPEDDS